MAQIKPNLANMTEKLQANDVQRRQPVVVRCCLSYTAWQSSGGECNSVIFPYGFLYAAKTDISLMIIAQYIKKINPYLSNAYFTLCGQDENNVDHARYVQKLRKH